MKNYKKKRKIFSEIKDLTNILGSTYYFRKSFEVRNKTGQKVYSTQSLFFSLFDTKYLLIY